MALSRGLTVARQLTNKDQKVDKTGCVRVLDSVDFHGQALMVISKDNEPYVAMRPIVEGMGLAWQPQHRKLTEDGVRFCVTMMVTQMPGDDQAREITTIPLRKLTGWLMTLQPSRMEASIAKKVLLYQNECDDALWAYWSKGVAVNPRASMPTDPTLMGLPDFRNPGKAAMAWGEQFERAEAAERGLQLAQAAVKQLEVRAAEAAPKLAFIAEIEASPTTYLVGQAAKLIYQGTKFPIGQNRLFAWLRDHGFLHQIGSRRNTPTQHSLESGLMVQQVRTVLINDQLRVCPTPRLTGKGLVYLVEHFYQQVQAKVQGQAPALHALPLLQAPITRPIQQLALDLCMVDEDEDLAVDDPDRPTIEA